MQVERLIELAQDTPTSALREAWGVHDDAVLSIKRGERPMTVREVGALAEIRGMKLEDILAI